MLSQGQAEVEGTRRKGKHASSTENRRMVWESVVWPLILDLNKPYFSLKEYHAKRDRFCKDTGMRASKVAGGFVSLLIKGIIARNKNIYSIHYRLIPYLRKRAVLEYGQVIREVNTKR
ncbi:hypothetical protein [Nitrososphaera sp.]|uniref:hypothetical protein n=1 Tax=Nitrososphaera sp. TaxID=1971748 RepID=UPI002EDACAE7